MIADATAAALRSALSRIGFADAAVDLMPGKGIAHRHYRVTGTGLVARVPGWSQAGLDPARHLDQEAGGFRRAEPSGRTPRLRAVIPPAADLPLGALLVTEIAGRLPRVSEDLPALARLLAAVHTLPVPPPLERPPLPAPADPVADTWAVIERQAPFFERAGLAAPALRLLREELDLVAARLALGSARTPPPVLVFSDTHPGNFLIGPDGEAWFLDLEKAMYGLAAIDLAHATLYTSATWDPACGAPVDEAATQAFYRAWLAAVPADVGAAMRPWFGLARRLTWLRTLSWMARWRATREGREDAELAPAHRDHIRRRIDDYFDLATLVRVRAEIDRFGVS